MSIDEIEKTISEYVNALENKSYWSKVEKQLKGLIDSFVKDNNISNLKTVEKKNIPFETENYIIILKKTIRDNFDSKAFFEFMGNEVKKEFSKETVYHTYEITEKAHKETEKTA